MRYYAHFGHSEFILCLGYKGNMIKDYFLNYDECRSNDFSIYGPDRKVELLEQDIDNWRITFLDTGMRSNIGQRMKAIEKYVADEEIFLANYSDGLSDLPINDYVEAFKKSDAIAGFISVRPYASFHVIDSDENNQVTAITKIRDSNVWINGGFFVFRREIFEWIRDGEELVEEPFQRLMAEGKLITWKYCGFWKGMDTYKDWKQLDEMYNTTEIVKHPWVLNAQVIKKINGSAK
jgi:glucose-1-phosphate cytidylyltransferase